MVSGFNVKFLFPLSTSSNLTETNLGPIFRYRPDSVLVNTPSGYRTLFGPTGNVKKGLYYRAWPSNANALSTWNSTDIEVHGRKRRVLNYAFSDKALRSAEPFLISNLDRWCEIIAKELPESGWSNSLNMADWVNYFIFDILGDFCFGKSFDMKEQESNLKYVPKLLAEFLKLMHPVGFDLLLDVLPNSLRPKEHGLKISRLHIRHLHRCGYGSNHVDSTN